MLYSWPIATKTPDFTPHLPVLVVLTLRPFVQWNDPDGITNACLIAILYRTHISMPQSLNDPVMLCYSESTVPKAPPASKTRRVRPPHRTTSGRVLSKLNVGLKLWMNLVFERIHFWTRLNHLRGFSIWEEAASGGKKWHIGHALWAKYLSMAKIFISCGKRKRAEDVWGKPQNSNLVIGIQTFSVH